MSGSSGAWSVLRLKLDSALGAARGPDAPARAVAMRELDGADLLCRPGTTDLLMAVMDYRGGLHLPPAGATIRPDGLIVELGANVGGALSSLGTRYPEARLVGAEPDPRNAALARRNLGRFGARASVVETAIWDRDTTLALRGHQSFGMEVFEIDDPSEAGGAPTVQAMTIDSLLDRVAPGDEIDYLLMTIEHAEPRVLAGGGEWVRRCRSIRVELHAPISYDAEACMAQLRSLGFEASADPHFFGGWAFGVRRA